MSRFPLQQMTVEAISDRLVGIADKAVRLPTAQRRPNAQLADDAGSAFQGSGRYAMHSAAVPAACGEAMLVPEIVL